MIKPASSGTPGKVLAMAALVGLALSPWNVALAKEKLPEVSKDGLHLQKDTKAAIVYAKPGATLDGFSEVMLVDCFVAFKKDWQRDYNLNAVGLEGRVTDKDAEKIKDELAAEFRKVFTDELTKKGHKVVDKEGEGVLLIRPALINVDVYAPDVSARMGRTLIRSAGEMTLYMELYDSATNTILARVIDPQADNNAFATQANRVTNKAAADRILRHWADALAKHLAEVTDKDSSG